MNRQSVIRLTRQVGAPLIAELPPPYLAPAIHNNVQSSSFSSTSNNLARRQFPDRSKSRGVSAIHRTGPKHPLSVSNFELPVPVSPEDLPPREINPDHGLWGFFPPDKLPISKPEYDIAHGRPWAIQELRGKSWDDLHCLWWICVKERNRIATSNAERERLKAGYGEAELIDRDRTIRVTQKCIKHVLRERWYAWEEARPLWLEKTEEEAKVLKELQLQKRAERREKKLRSKAKEAPQDGSEA